MTYKVSFFKSVREMLKHHIASAFASAVIFLIQFLVFFLQVQNFANTRDLHNYATKTSLHKDMIAFTEPGYAYFTPIVIVAVILAFDYFRYLHSKTQMDFYESLPVKRKEWFKIRTTSAFIVFYLPYIICTVLECVLLFAYDFRSPVYFFNIMWNVICMTLIYLITWITAVLAMVMTGHSVIAAFGFAIFCGYFPIIVRYLFPIYAECYFDTYVSTERFLNNLIYISPIGSTVSLLGNNFHQWFYQDHLEELLIMILLIVFVFLITFVLFKKRPSEAAGHAMSFEKANPYIRILLVIPLALYLGMYFYLITSVGQTLWMIIGFVLGVFLLHGIIESIFQFDIRGMWSHKIQMVICFVATIGIAFTFWVDLFGFDSYIPAFHTVKAIKLDLNDPYHYKYSGIDGLHEEQMETAYQLIENVIEEERTHDDGRYFQVTFELNNGKTVNRSYYINVETNRGLIDAIYATKDYKNDICELYDFNRDNIKNIKWNDNVSSYPIDISDADMDILLDTFLAEFTPITFTEVIETSSIGRLDIYINNENGYGDLFSCHIFPQFDQTIALLEESLGDYGSVTTPLLTRYQIKNIDVYLENEPLYITDPEVINEIKDDLIVANDYYVKYNGNNDGTYYDATAELSTHEGISHISVLVPVKIIEPYMN